MVPKSAEEKGHTRFYYFIISRLQGYGVCYIEQDVQICVFSSLSSHDGIEEVIQLISLC